MLSPCSWEARADGARWGINTGSWPFQGLRMVLRGEVILRRAEQELTVWLCMGRASRA